MRILKPTLILCGVALACRAMTLIGGTNGPDAASSLALFGLIGSTLLLAAFVPRTGEMRAPWVMPISQFSRPLFYGVLSAFAISSTVSAQSTRAPVNLGTAGNYVVLTETGITDVPPSVITGNIGASPITGAAIHVTCAEVAAGGTISAVDAAGPAPCALINPVGLGVAIGDMTTAYADAAGRTIPDFTELGAGNISGKTLVPGLYKWSTGVLVDNTGVTLSGGPNAVWIFQVAGDILLNNNAHINLAGGARANNIFWQSGGPTSVTLGTGTVFNGNILSAKQIIMNTGAVLNGRAFAQTQVTLQSTGITTPGPLVGGIPIVLTPTVSSTVPANLALGVPTNIALSATFSEAMDPATINSLTFTLKNGLTPVSGAVTYAGVSATFTPTGNLLAGTAYTATITTGAKDSTGAALAANYVWNFTTGGVVDITPPTVSSTVPTNGAGNVATSSAFSATFSEAMNPATINTTTFTVKQGATAVAGTVSYAGVTATFSPAGALAPNTAFTATITTGAKDLAGNALASNYSWTFSTGATPDTTRPTVISTVPTNGATNVPIGSALAAVFSESMNPLSVNTTSFTVSQGATAISGTVTYAGTTATFSPLKNLAANLPFTATITTGVTDLAGNALATNYVWTFTSGANPDQTPPTVISTAPANGAVLITVSANLVATFSEFMNPLTINTSSFLLTQGTTPVSGTVTYSGTSATFSPTSSLLLNTVYTATITTAATDLAGNPLQSSYSWSFTSGNSAGQTPVCLVSFAVLAGSAINSSGPTIVSGPTVITGDIGVSPGSIVTGFPPGTLNGSIHAGDAAAAQAMADFTAGYTDAAARSNGPVAVSADIGGQTFTPGLYRAGAALQILAGDVTLDAKGNANAVFVFQTPATFTTAPGRRIILAGGAQAFNVFWQVGTSATLGSGTVFSGSILADQSITMGDGATLAGRLAARTGTVTLTSNTIVSPPPYIAVGAIYNAANWGPPVAAGSIAAVFGTNLASSLTAATSYPLLTTLGGSSFQVGAQNAPLFMTSCGQANLQIPWEAAGQTQLPVTATAGGLVSAKQTVNLVPFAPGIFSLNQQGSGQGAVEIAPTAVIAGVLGSGSRPVKRGEYIAIFSTGLGPVTNQPLTGGAASSNPLSYTTNAVTVTVGNVPAQVTYGGLAPGFAGLYQVNAIVPDATLTGDNISVVISINGVLSNTVTIAIQ